MASKRILKELKDLQKDPSTYCSAAAATIVLGPQNTAIGSTDITDTWEPLEEGLLP